MSASYWEDTVAESLEEFGIKLTSDQLIYVCESIQISHEHYGMAHGYDHIPNPLETEIRNVKAAGTANIDDLEKRHRSQVEELEYQIRRLRQRVAELQSQGGQP